MRGKRIPRRSDFLGVPPCRTNASCSPACAAVFDSDTEFNGIYIFGDSLSDAGNYLRSGAGHGSFFTTNWNRTCWPGPVFGAHFGIRHAIGSGRQRLRLRRRARLQSSGHSTRAADRRRHAHSDAVPHCNIWPQGTGHFNAVYSIFLGTRGNGFFIRLQVYLARVTTRPRGCKPQRSHEEPVNLDAKRRSRSRTQGARYVMIWNLPDIGLTRRFEGLWTGRNDHRLWRRSLLTLARRAR